VTIELELGDITSIATDAVVNAANSRLLPGGGVSGAIHAAAGPELARACAEHIALHGEVEPGHAAITPGFRLRARFVIHAVGPIWHSGDHAEEAFTLASAYRESIRLADEAALTSIAFPSISTGVFGYPVALAAPVAIGAVREALDHHAQHVREVRFVLFDRTTYDTYEAALREISAT
jgi:O-acetyl-ADP-ribose deacetylase (regulator of RNase III)